MIRNPCYLSLVGRGRDRKAGEFLFVVFIGSQQSSLMMVDLTIGQVAAIIAFGIVIGK
jgi:hypothetical protein